MNLSGEAVETKGILAPLIEFYADYDFSRLEMAFDSKDGDGIHRFRARANWKTLWENYAPETLVDGNPIDPSSEGAIDEVVDFYVEQFAQFAGMQGLQSIKFGGADAEGLLELIAPPLRLLDRD